MLVVGIVAQEMLKILVQLLTYSDINRQLIVWSCMFALLFALLLLVHFNLIVLKSNTQTFVVGGLILGLTLVGQTVASLIEQQIISTNDLHHQLLFWIILFFCSTTVALVTVGLERSRAARELMPRVSPGPSQHGNHASSVQPINKLTFRMLHQNGYNKSLTLV